MSDMIWILILGQGCHTSYKHRCLTNRNMKRLLHCLQYMRNMRFIVSGKRPFEVTFSLRKDVHSKC